VRAEAVSLSPVSLRRPVPFASQPLWSGDLLRAWRGGDAAGASREYAPGDGGVDVPLVVKLLDIGDRLSVQVHPDDASARDAGVGPHGKSEGWVVLAAGEGARVAFGVAAPLTRAELRAHVEAGTVGDALRWVPVRPGDVYSLPAGTVHAARGPVLLYEVQRPCDVTWRLHDWGRGRALAVERGVGAARLLPEPAPAPPVALPGGGVRLLRTEWGCVDAREAPARWVSPRAEVLTVVEGVVEAEGERLPRGCTFTLPAGPRVLEGHGRVLVASAP